MIKLSQYYIPEMDQAQIVYQEIVLSEKKVKTTNSRQ